MPRFISTDDYDEEMGTDVKEEDDEDDDGERNVDSGSLVDVDGGLTSATGSNRFVHNKQYQEQPSTQGASRRCRPQEEKERTKLRERQRRAITAKILAGLRRHGNYNLRVRADINDVIAALAREAGWVVLPDGTTFPSRQQGPQDMRSVACTSNVVVTSSSSHLPLQSAPLRGSSPDCQNIIDYDGCQMGSVLLPVSPPYDAPSSVQSLTSAFLGDEGDARIDPLLKSSIDSIGNKQVVDVPTKLQEHDFAGTPCVPVYVMLPFGVINMKGEVNDPDSLVKQLRVLKSVNVDGVMVDCWWGIVEAHEPQEYNWNGYKRLFHILRELKLKLKVVLSFHECGGNIGDDVCIPLPHWVAEIGRTNPDIFFTDRAGRRNPECLSWGIDKERVLRGRTAVEVYFDYMRSFRVEFNEFFEDGSISIIEIGLGPCGELRFPSCPVKHGWRYPGVGEFQCYDQNLLKSLRKAAETRGHPFWARGPDNAGSYNSRPHETGFFCDGGDYDGYYGRFFLKWYSQVMIDHGDRVLSLAKLAFEGAWITAKLSGISWWYKTASHAAELTAGYYNSCNRDGYAPIMHMLKKHGVTLNFPCAEISMSNQHVDFSASVADPGGLTWQVLNAAWDAGVPVIGENALPCHDRDGFNHLLEKVKPMNDPDGRHFPAFSYLRLNPLLLERHNLLEFERFVKRMHGEAVLDMSV